MGEGPTILLRSPSIVRLDHELSKMTCESRRQHICYTLRRCTDAAGVERLDTNLRILCIVVTKTSPTPLLSFTRTHVGMMDFYRPIPLLLSTRPICANYITFAKSHYQGHSKLRAKQAVFILPLSMLISSQCLISGQ